MDLLLNRQLSNDGGGGYQHFSGLLFFHARGLRWKLLLRLFGGMRDGRVEGGGGLQCSGNQKKKMVNLLINLTYCFLNPYC